MEHRLLTVVDVALHRLDDAEYSRVRLLHSTTLQFGLGLHLRSEQALFQSTRCRVGLQTAWAWRDVASATTPQTAHND